MDERLKRLIARRGEAVKAREKLVEQRRAIVEVAEGDGRDDLTVEEDTEFRALTEKIATLDEGDEDTGVVGIAQLDERIEELSGEARREEALAKRTAKVRAAVDHARVTSEARTYESPRAGGRHSYFRDLVRVQMNIDGADESRARLLRHADEVRTDAELRALDRTDGAGGYFVPPLWLMSQWVELARAGRPYANLVNNQDLPGGTDSINIPKMATGTETAIQTADNAPIADTDATDDTVNAPVRTIAGQQDMAVQLLDQSPVNFDEIIFQDLVADLATKVNAQVVSGSGASGQVLGVRNTSGIITVTAGTATVVSVYSKLADAIQRIHTQRFMSPTAIVMHPRRWGWFTAAVDGQNRPLVLPSAGAPQNVMGTLGVVGSQQVVGQMHGLPVVTDPGLPTNLGVGTNEDVIHVVRAVDLLLWESSIRSRTYPTPTSGIGSPSTLSTRIEVYEYLAFTAGRYPTSVAEIGGAGLAAPTF